VPPRRGTRGSWPAGPQRDSHHPHQRVPCLDEPGARLEVILGGDVLLPVPQPTVLRDGSAATAPVLPGGRLPAARQRMAHAVTACRSSLLVIWILRGLAASLTGMVRVSTPAV
jgi:hypothetical protein